MLVRGRHSSPIPCLSLRHRLSLASSEHDAPSSGTSQLKFFLKAIFNLCPFIPQLKLGFSGRPFYKAEKAKEIKPQEIIRVSTSRFRVKGYAVDLEAYACDCPDYARSNSNPRLRVKLPCKHIIAAERLAGLNERQEGLGK